MSRWPLVGATRWVAQGVGSSEPGTECGLKVVGLHLENLEKENVMIKKLSKSGGFTLIEIIIVLAIIGMLAGILAPTMVKYVQSAKLRRATEDVKMIGTSIGNFYNDLGEWPIWKDGSAMIGTGTTATAYSILRFGTIDTTAGATLGDVTSADATAGGGWTAALLTGTDQTSGAKHLWINDPDIDGTSGTATDYPDAADLKYAWRGPYIEQFRPDPWGNNYLVNVIQLWPANEQGTGVCYVLSAGPDKVLQTAYVQAGPNMTITGDDIVFRIK